MCGSVGVWECVCVCGSVGVWECRCVGVCVWECVGVGVSNCNPYQTPSNKNVSPVSVDAGFATERCKKVYNNK